MSLNSVLSIAGGGLANVASGLSVLSQNIANAQTPGYAREVATSTSIDASGIGGGVRTGPTTRQIDTQLEQDVDSQNATVAGLQTRQSALQTIDAVQGTPGGGSDLASMLGNLQDAFATLQTDPSNPAQQSNVVVAAQSLTQQINAVSDAYTKGRQNAQDTITSGVALLNSTLSTIGGLSDQIVALRAGGQSTADLENQRSAAMQSLSQLVGARFIEQPNGDMIAATASGASLPMHSRTPPFSVSDATVGTGSSYPATLPGIMLNGVDVTAQLRGGQLGAAVTLRDATLPTYQAELDEFAQTLSTRFAGQGLSLFTDPNGAIPTGGGTPAQAGYVGYAADVTVNPAVVAAPSLVRDGTSPVTGSVSGATAFTPNPAGGPAGFTGMIERVLDYALGAQVQNGIAQPPPATAGLGPSGTLAAPFAAPPDLSQFAVALVTSQASDSAATSSQLTTEQAVQTALQSKLGASSGVSIDVEMSNMVQLQNAYAANAKVISTLQSVWTDLLAILP